MVFKLYENAVIRANSREIRNHFVCITVTIMRVLDNSEEASPLPSIHIPSIHCSHT